MKNTLFFTLLILCSFTVSAQEKTNSLAFLTSDTKYKDETPFKTKVISFGISAQQGILEDADSPSILFLSGGYEFRKLTFDESIYFGIGPRLRAGYLSGKYSYYDWDWDNRRKVSYDSFVWGASVVPSAGIILDEDNYLTIFMEGEIGIINYDLRKNTASRNKSHHKDYWNLNLACRGGFRGTFFSKVEGSVWVSLSNDTFKDVLKDDSWYFPLLTEIGIGIGF